jgi:hypothetical protein
MKKFVRFFIKNDNIIINIIAVLGSILSIWGFVVAYKVTGVDYNIFNSAYSTIRLFAFDLDAPDNKADLVWQLELARWMITLFMFYYIAKGIILIAKTNYELFLLKISNGGHIIICGAGEKGKILALDWIEKMNNEEIKRRKIFFIEPDNNNPNLETLKEAGAIIIAGKAQEKSILKKLKIEKAKYFVTTTDHDTTNIEIISTLMDSKILDNIEKPLKCYIHLIHNEFYDFFMAKDFNGKNMKIKTDIKIFNVHNNSARMLFDDKILGHNVFKTKADIIDKTKKVKIAIFGFGKLGENILIHALQLGHFYNNNPIEVTVVYDKDKVDNSNIEDEFIKQYNIGIEKNKDNQFNQKFSEYWKIKFIDDGDFIKEDLKEYSQIIIAYEDEFESLSNLMKLLKRDNNTILSNNIDIAIYSNSFPNSANIIDNDRADKDNEYTVFNQVRTFGELNKTCNYDMIINAKLDIQAKTNHEYYEILHNAVSQGWSKPWDKLDIFTKDSNRYLMEHNKIKESIINIFINECETPFEYKKIKQEIENKFFSYPKMKINWDDIKLNDQSFTKYATHLSSEEIEQLGIVEHKRWNAFHILNGWEKLEIPKDTKTVIKKDVIRKLHPCLVSWNELDIVSKNHNHDFKSDDIETFMRIPALNEKIANL